MVVAQLSRMLLAMKTLNTSSRTLRFVFCHSNTVVIVSHNKVGCPVILPLSVLLQLVNKTFVTFVSPVCCKLVSLPAFWNEWLLVVCKMQMYIHWVSIDAKVCLQIATLQNERMHTGSKRGAGDARKGGRRRKVSYFFRAFPCRVCLTLHACFLLCSPEKRGRLFWRLINSSIINTP